MTEQVNRAFEVEQHGFDPIPESERTMKMRDLNATWLGSNAYLVYFTFGVIVFGLGLNVWESIACCIIGNLLWTVIGVGSIAGIRSGLPTMTLTRAPFGVLGNRFNGLFAWLTSVAFEALNTVFGVLGIAALLEVIGWHNSGTPGKIIALVVTFFISALIAVVGHATLVWFQRIFAVVLTLAMVAVFFYTIGGVDFSAGPKTTPSTGAVIALMFAGCAVIGGGGPLSYLFNCCDWARYMPSKTKSRSIVWNVSWSAGLISLMLCIMGVLLASRGNVSDPVGGVRPMVPEWLFIIYAISAVGGAVSNNVITFYASGLTLQSVGLPLKRYQATMVDLTVSTFLTIYVVFISSSFTTDVNDFVSLLPVWIAPFGGIWIADGLMRRWQYDARSIHDTSPSSRYWGSSGFNVQGFIALFVGVGFCLLVVNSPVLVGPISNALSGADFTWILGAPVAAGVYYVLARVKVRAEVTAPAAAAAVGATTEPAGAGGAGVAAIPG
ncbi:MAG: purine-cytosine permease family protein [Solirubrobacteraceae bacterium]